MAHQIESFVTANVPAWHQLGTVLPGAFTAQEAMTYGHLGGWNVRKSPLIVAETGEAAPDAFATVRDNPLTPGKVDVLGIVGSQYHPVQNEELCDLLDTLVDESGSRFDTAGSIREGKQVFVTMRLPGHMLIGGVDAHEDGQPHFFTVAGVHLKNGSVVSCGCRREELRRTIAKHAVKTHGLSSHPLYTIWNGWTYLPSFSNYK
jgi:hypothetical protein